MLEAGRIAPEFSLKDLDGRRRSLRENLKHAPVLVVFFKISCEACHLTLPFLERLKEAVRIVGISQDDVPSTKEFLEYFKITIPVLMDPPGDSYAVSNAYHIAFVPSMFLIEQDGRISWALQGFHKGNLEALGERLHTSLFQPGEKVPLLKPGCSSKN